MPPQRRRDASPWDDAVARFQFLAAIREGASRADAATRAGSNPGALARRLANDDDLRHLVETAEYEARQKGPASPAKADPVDPWAKVRAEAAALCPGPMGYVLWVDGRVSQRGMPPISRWWRATLRRFYESGKRWFLARAGRRIGKSTTSSRVGIAHAIYVERDIPPGDTGVVPIFSTEKREAGKRLDTFSAVLERLDIPHKVNRALEGGGTITGLVDSQGHKIEIQVFPATVSAASGFTGIWELCDEETKWRNKETNANPADAVLDALRPTMTTQPEAVGFRVSSAYAQFGTHYDDIEKGADELHFIATIGEEFLDLAKAGFYAVAAWEEEKARTGPPEHRTMRLRNAKRARDYANNLTADSPNIPSWVGNESGTADPVKTRIEVKPAPEKFGVWMREFGSVSSASTEEAFFDGACLDAAEQREIPRGRGQRFAGLDTGAVANAFALAIVERIGAVVRPVYLREWIPAPGAPLDIDRETLPEAARLTRDHGAHAWRTDAWYEPSLSLRAHEAGIQVIHTGPDPFREIYEPVRRGIHRGDVCLSGCDGASEAVRQLRQVRSRVVEGERTKIVIPHEGDLHGDLGVALARALAAAGVGTETEEEPPEWSDCGTQSRYAEDRFG